MNAKRKGNRTELKVVEWLREWTGADFNRIPMSGALRWSNAERVAGDVIAPPDFYFPFVLEVKSRQTLNFRILKSGKMADKNQFSNFYIQAYHDCHRINSYGIVDLDCIDFVDTNEKHHKQPIVFARQDRMPANTFYVCTNSRLSNAIELMNGNKQGVSVSTEIKFQPLVYNQSISIPHPVEAKTIQSTYSVYNSEDLKLLNYQDLISVYDNFC